MPPVCNYIIFLDLDGQFNCWTSTFRRFNVFNSSPTSPMSTYHFNNRSQHLGHSMRARIEALDTSSRRNAPHVDNNCPNSLDPRAWQTDYSQDSHSPTRFANYSESHTQAQGSRPLSTHNHHLMDTEGVCEYLVFQRQCDTSSQPVVCMTQLYPRIKTIPPLPTNQLPLPATMDGFLPRPTYYARLQITTYGRQLSFCAGKSHFWRRPCRLCGVSFPNCGDRVALIFGKLIMPACLPLIAYPNSQCPPRPRGSLRTAVPLT